MTKWNWPNHLRSSSSVMLTSLVRFIFSIVFYFFCLQISRRIAIIVKTKLNLYVFCKVWTSFRIIINFGILWKTFYCTPFYLVTDWNSFFFFYIQIEEHFKIFVIFKINCMCKFTIWFLFILWSFGGEWCQSQNQACI